MKKVWGERLITVWPRQGQNAFDTEGIATYPPPNFTLERVGDPVNCNLPALAGAVEADGAL